MELDRFVPRHSPIHRADARLKIVVTFAAVLGIALLPVGAFAAYLVTWVALAAASIAARLGPLRLVRGSWVVLPFAFVALPLLFTREGETVIAFSLGPLDLTITDTGIRDVLSIVLKSWLSVQAALLLTYTTPFSSIVDGLRALRLPAIIVNIISFMYRYLAVLMDEASRMSRARQARSAAVPKGRSGGSVRWRARVTGSMVGSLFIRSYERSERVYAAMLARGFDGTFRTAALTRPADRELLVFGGLLAAIVLFVALVNLSLGLMATPSGHIHVEHLHFSYPDGTEALRGVELELAAGEKVALVGPNGAGKSTLMLHLNGILGGGHGHVSIGGVTVEPTTAKQIRAAVGLVFQDPDDQLFSPTVGEDVAFGPIHMGVAEREIHHRVERALDAVGMSGMSARVPHHLSLGQRKRISIATVLSMDPSVLVFDEPTAGLDPRGRRELIEVLRARTETLLVSTHDLAMVAEALPRTVLIDDGVVVADGPSAELLVDDALLEAHGLERPCR